MTRPARHRAFTLLELLLVLSVVATLGILVAPRMSASLGLSRLRDQVREAQALAKLARGRAANEGRVYLLNYDPETRELRLLRRRDPLAAPTDEEFPERELPREDERWSRPVLLNDGVEVIEAEVEGLEWDLITPLEYAFRPGGDADAGWLTFAHGEDQLTLVIDGPLALARIADIAPIYEDAQ